MSSDPLYGGSIARRRRKRRLWLSGILMAIGALGLVAALIQQSYVLAAGAVLVMAIASQLPMKKDNNNS